MHRSLMTRSRRIFGAAAWVAVTARSAPLLAQDEEALSAPMPAVGYSMVLGAVFLGLLVVCLAFRRKDKTAPAKRR